MKNQIDTLINISNISHSYIIYYQFNRSIKQSIQYKDGRIDASTWINELIYCFIKNNKTIIDEFISILNKQKEKVSTLNNCDYKKGLYDQLTLISTKIEKVISA